MLQNIRTGLARFFVRPSITAKVDPDTPFALYFHPSGKVQPLTLRSLKSWGTGGDYNALAASLSNRSGGAPASEQGYAYISLVNVWVRRCIEIRASTIKRLDWFVEDIRTGKRIPDHALMIAINRARHFMRRVERSLDIWGELYIKPLENQYGYTSDVWWINNLSINFNIVNGYIGQFYYVPLHGGKPYIWQPDEMCYIYSENPFDDLHGSSRILAVLQEANVHEEIARAAQAHFANDARPGIMFIPETDLGVPQSEEFIEYWKANFQGSMNTNKPVVLPYLMKTIQTIERAALKDDVEMRESIRREICAAFGVPLSVAGAWDDASYQSAPEQRKSLYEDTIIPEADQIKDDLNRSLMPFFDDDSCHRLNYDAKHLLALAEDRQQKAAALSAQLASGGITVNEYRQALDEEAIPQGNVFYVPAGVIVTPVEKLGTMPPPAPPGGGFGFNSAPSTVSVEKPEPPALPETTEKAAGSLCMLLSLANDTGLIQLQNQLKQRAPDSSIQWVDPNDFHVTLVYIPSLAEPQVTELLSYKDYYETDELALNVGSLASFDKIGEHALHFRIRENAALRGFQRDLVDLCKDCGLSVSPFNDPAGWKPHITMGYAPRAVPFTSFASGLKVKPTELHISMNRDGQRTLVYRGQVGRVIEAPPIAAKMEGATITSAVWNVPEGATVTAGNAQPQVAVDPFLDELNRYEKFTINRWGQPLRAFEFRVITEPLVTELTGQVKACTRKDQVRRLFEGLRTALKKTGDDAYVTPEQAQEWWGDYDKLMRTIGKDWLRDYMREVWRKLELRLNKDISKDDVAALLEDFHPDLITKWTGTADEPGVIAKLFMAGMGAGQAALERSRTNMNPNKAASELNIDWSLVPADAIKEVERYVKRLVGQLDKTTLKEFQAVLIQWLESGGTLDDLKRQLTPVFNDPDRADLIATTEASEAYNRGAIARWEDAGVTEMKFRSVRDAKVCPVCSQLHGKIGTLEQGWYSDELNDYVTIPVHQLCRCYASPVL